MQYNWNITVYGSNDDHTNFLLNAAANPANRSASVKCSESSSSVSSFHSLNGSSGYFAFFEKQLLIALPTYSPLIQPESDILSRRYFICSRKNGRYLSMILGLSFRNTSSGISYLTASGIHTSWIISVSDFHLRGGSCCSFCAAPGSEDDCSSDTVLLCCSFSDDPAAVFCRPV